MYAHFSEVTVINSGDINCSLVAAGGVMMVPKYIISIIFEMRISINLEANIQAECCESCLKLLYTS